MNLKLKVKGALTCISLDITIIAGAKVQSINRVYTVKYIERKNNQAYWKIN